MTARALPLDQDARTVIERALDRNLFVEAGAGTGKTTALVRRVVRLVATGHLAEIRQLAAITFTEAAAAELRDRIRTALEVAADPASPSDLDDAGRDRCRHAAAHIDEAVITTLHGFAQRILAEHPVAARLPPAFEVDEGIPAELEFVRRWQAFVDELVGDPELTEVLRVGATLDLLLPRLAEVARALKDRWDRLAPPPPAAGGPGVDLGAVATGAAAVLAAYDAVAELHAPHAGADDGLAVHVEEHVLPLRDALADAAATGDPLEILRVLDTAELPTAGNRGLATRWGSDKATIKELLAEARDRARGLLDGLRTQVIARLTPELVRFTLEWADERRRSGRLHFHDLLVLARDLLWRDAGVRRALAQRWSVLVVDEFQDTDPLQVELVFALAAADPDRLPATWQDIELGPGRVLVVGDPKQSIYRFRGADPGLWNRTRALFGEEGVVGLTQNFRSVQPVLDWVNRVFEQLIGAGDGDVQPSYAALTPHRTTLDAGHQVLFIGGPSTDRAATVRLREAEEIALAVTTLRASGHQVVDDRPGAAPGACRPMRYDDVAVLVPTRAPIGALERALDDHDIPYRIESRSLVWRTDAVREVLNLLTAADNPADDVAVVAALRSPAFACTDPELLEWRTAGGRWDHTAPAPASLPPDHPVAAAMATLRAWHDERHWQPVDAIVDRVIAERRLIELTMAQRRPRDHWRRLRFVADQARAFVEAGGASLSEFLSWAALQVEEGAAAVETVVAEPDDDAVRVLTVHGAKGLEFPVVVLAGLANGRSPTLTDVAWTDAGPEVMVTAYGGGRRFATAGWADATQDARAFDEAEAIRLLYVAATRARDTLIVSLHHPRRVSGSLIARLYPVVAGTQEQWAPSPPPAPLALFRPDTPPPRTAAARAAWRSGHEAALAAARRGLAVSPTGLAHGGPDGPGGPDEPDDDAAPPAGPEPPAGDHPVEAALGARPAGRGGTAVGRAVHRVLEHVDLGGTGPIDPAAIAALAAGAAAAEGLPAGDAATVAELAASALGSAALTEARRAGRFWREVPLVVPVGDRVLEGFVDLLYERPGGSLVVVDWKTDRARTPQEIDRSLARYRTQGAAYALALGAATGRPVAEVRFVFCRSGGEPAVERTITDLASARAEVEAMVR